jgi:hypothetical protein
MEQGSNIPGCSRDADDGQDAAKNGAMIFGKRLMICFLVTMGGEGLDWSAEKIKLFKKFKR